MSQTTGNLTAVVVNAQVTPPTHSFKGDADRMMMYFLGDDLHISATQVIGPEINQLLGFDFSLPGVVADGVMRTYRFDGGSTRGIYWAYQDGGGTPYSAVTGSLSVALDRQDRLVGTFEFTAVNANKHVQVNRGELDLVGFITEVQATRTPPDVTGTGYMRGAVPGGPMPSPEFDASMVSIRKVPGIFEYWEVVGRQFDGDFPAVQNLVLIVVAQGTVGTSFELPCDEVRVTFGRVNSFGFAYAISGRIDFTSMPESGHAVGSLDCRVQRNQDPPFALQMTFDITDSV